MLEFDDGECRKKKYHLNSVYTMLVTRILVTIDLHLITAIR